MSTIVLLICSLTLSFPPANTLDLPKYPAILTPDDHDDKYWTALPNSDHASIQYGEDDKTEVISRHYHHNGYHDFHYKDEDDSEKLGLRDVIHSVGTFLNIIQTFPKLAGRGRDQQKFATEVGLSPAFEVVSEDPNAFLFPGENSEEVHNSSSTFIKTAQLTPTTNLMPPLAITHPPVNSQEDDDPWIMLSQVDRHQCTYNDQVNFPCSDVKPSFYKPTSVHELRPADIQVVAALGDALVSAQGALSVGITTSTDEYRGVSFATGGDEDWRTLLSIPNILREFNPRLIGTSSGTAGGKHGVKGFNVAENFAFSADLESQADELISRIKRNQNIDMREDWKLVLVLVGQNDLCKLACIHNGTLPQFDGGGNPEPLSPKDFARNVQKGLDRLKKGLPRSIVALILPPDPTLAMEAFHRPLVCHLSSKVICPCVDGPNNIGRASMLRVLDEYHKALYDMVNDGDFDEYSDFTVVIQPGLLNMKLPKNYVTFFGIHKQFLPDLSYLSSDCFHPSQKMQALIAKNIWNNLLEPVGAKSNWNRFASLKCPSDSNPFLATDKNSDSTEEHNKPFQRKRLRRRRKKTVKRSPTDLLPFFDTLNDVNCDLL